MGNVNLYIIGFLTAALAIVTSSFGAADIAKGPLKVHSKNSRYFSDTSGKPVYLVGSHNWWTLQDSGTEWPPSFKKVSGYDYGEYLDFLQQHNHNFIRLWAWEQRNWAPWTKDNCWIDPLPWALAEGTALDGRQKFDLSKFNQAHFDRLRERVIQARDRGIYVGVMLFEGWSVFFHNNANRPGNPWKGHPFNRENNVNGIDGDPENTGQGILTHTMSDDPKIKAVREYQEAYVKKVIDTVNDLDNVLYEIGNEMGRHSTEWQYHIINVIKDYEKGKPKQHPVGMTFQWRDGRNEDLFTKACPADWVSPGPGPNNIYLDDPPIADGEKVVLLDTDHLWGVGGDRSWVWKSLTRGYNPIYMDPLNENFGGKQYDHALLERARKAMGDSRKYAVKMNLAAALPNVEIASTKYALVNPGKEYLVYQPESDKEFTVRLKAGKYRYEWFNAAEGKVAESGKIRAAEGDKTFTAPFSGDAVLYLKAR